MHYAHSPLLALPPLRNTEAPRVGEPVWNARKPTPYRSGRRIFPRRQGRFSLQGWFAIFVVLSRTLTHLAPLTLSLLRLSIPS
jgi:hypothetical protein